MRETDSFRGTKLQELIEGLDGVYGEIASACADWSRVSPARCPTGCGSCCHDFEPDVLEVEALYMAAWIVFHQVERADAISGGTFVPFRSDPERGCFLFDPDNAWHCSVYGGRPTICRMFGEAGDRGKDGHTRWKPCKFLPTERDGESLQDQYLETELISQFGSLPPVMSDLTAQLSSLIPDGVAHREPLHKALPEAIARIRMMQGLVRPEL